MTDLDPQEREALDRMFRGFQVKAVAAIRSEAARKHFTRGWMAHREFATRGDTERPDSPTDDELTELIEMPRELARVLKDPGIIVKQDAAVFDLIAKWQNAPWPSMPPNTKRYVRDEQGNVHGSIEARFWKKVNRDGPIPACCPELGKCWLWTGAKGGGPPPYGSLGLGARHLGSVSAHRVAYELLIRRVRDGFVLDHRCRNRLCVNPSHLREVTNRKNILLGGSASAVNARKTHCRSGHPLKGANLKIEKTGRRCRQCKREQQARERSHRITDWQPVGA
jgi:hypothetical protein